MGALISTTLYFQPLKVLKIISMSISNCMAKKHIKNYPQLAILSFDHIGLSINLNGRYEDESLQLVERYIQEKMPESKNQVALDIGANIGNHSIFFSTYFRKVYSFEPNPIAHDILKINAKYATSNKNVIPIQLGLSAQEGQLPFSINPSNIGSSRVSLCNDNKICSNNKISVRVEKADALGFLQKETIALIKIDVEGHEFNALQGAANIIKVNKPLILFEQNTDDIVNGKSQAIDYLASIGYRFYTIKKNFDFGNSFFSRFVGFLLRLLFGSQLSFVKTEIFQKRYHDMILAVALYE